MNDQNDRLRAQIERTLKTVKTMQERFGKEKVPTITPQDEPKQKRLVATLNVER